LEASLVAELSIEDRVMITDLIARYARTLDSGDLDGYVRNFAPDGVLFEAHRGHDAIRSYVAGVIARRQADPNRTRHFAGAPTIDGAGDTEHATVHSYLLWITEGAELPIHEAAEYNDVVVKHDGRWVFESRALTRLSGRR
jgi:uncharacterized protein (TIGR02246 family)